MNLNSLAMIQQLKAGLDQFKLRHPKFPLFLNAVSEHALYDGTVIEITVTAPEGKSFSSNLKLTSEDLELIQKLQSMNPS